MSNGNKLRILQPDQNDLAKFARGFMKAEVMLSGRMDVSASDFGRSLCNEQSRCDGMRYRIQSLIQKKERLTSLISGASENISGMNSLMAYVRQLDFLKLFYASQKPIFLPTEALSYGAYIRGSEIYTFKPDLDMPSGIAISRFEMDKEAPSDLLISPTLAPTGHSGLLVAEGIPGTHFEFNSSRNTLDVVAYFMDVWIGTSQVMQSWVDGGTKTLRREVFQNELTPRMIRWLNQGVDFTIMLADLDGLKTINDVLGHSAGDKALEAISRILVEARNGTVSIGMNKPYSDLVVRWGGDEFIVVMLGITAEEACPVAHSMVEKSFETRIFDMKASVSIGMLDSKFLLNRLGELEKKETFLFDRLDDVFYHAKDIARNKGGGGISFIDQHGRIQSCPPPCEAAHPG